MDVTVEVTGLQEMMLVLEQFPIAVEKKAVNKALFRIAEPIVATAVLLAPYRTGAITRNITAKVARDKDGHAGRVIIGVRVKTSYRRRQKGKPPQDRNDPFYWYFQEQGWNLKTAKGSIRIPGKKFLRKAWDSQIGNSLERFTQALALSLDEVVQEARRKAGLPPTYRDGSP